MLVKRIKKIFKDSSLTLLLFTVIFSGCTLPMMYNYLDWILPWYLDDYVSLTDQQEQLVDRATLKFMDWHRAEELPRYASFIGSLKNAQSSPMNQQQVLLFFDEATHLWTTVLAKSMPELMLLARQLSDKQVIEIDEALAADIEELQEEYGGRTESEQRLFWQTKMLDSLDDWLGNVTDLQKELIKQWGKIRINTTEEWLAYRNDWRKKFITLLKNRGEDDFTRKMKDFLLHPQKTYSNSYKQSVLQNRNTFAQLLADLSSSLTTEQRNYLKRELAEVIVDLNDLSSHEG